MDGKISLIEGLSVPERFQLVTYLIDSPRSIDEITDHLKLSKPETLDHIDYLMHQGMIETGTNGKKYNVSSLGALLVKLYAPLDFILDRMDFFKSHGFSNLPWKLKREIGSLVSSEYIDDLERLGVVIQESINSAVDELLVMTGKEFTVESLELRACDCILPPEMITLGNQLRKKCERVNFRFMKETNFALYIADKDRAVLIFPDNSGKTDYSCGFFINDNMGLHFVDLLWSYFWRLAGQMAF